MPDKRYVPHPMGRYFLGFILLFLPLLGISQQNTYQYSGQNAPLEQVLLDLEARYELKFSYSPQLLAGIRITQSAKTNQLSAFLDQIFEETGLEYLLQDEGFVAIRKAKPSTLKICVALVDSANRTPLAFARIKLLPSQRGGYTDENGNFSLSVPLETSGHMEIQYSGYGTAIIPISPDLSQCPTFMLAYRGFESEEVVIQDYLTDGVSLGQEGETVIIRPRRASAFPGQATPDVFHSIRFLPGISSPGGELSQLNVRGGTPDQSLVMWESIPMYHTAHYFGMLSAINPYFIDQVKVYRGSFGANLGGRIAGIVDMQTSDESPKNARVGGGVDMMHAFAQGGVSLADQRLSVSFSLRRSIADLWQSPTYNAYTNRIIQGNLIQKFNTQTLPEKVGLETDFLFWDGFIKTKAQVSKHDVLTASVFRLANTFNSEINDTIPSGNIDIQTDSLTIVNNGFGVSWEHRWNRNWSSTLKGLSTDYSLDYSHFLFRSSRPRRPDEAVRTNYLQEQQFHWNNTYEDLRGLRLQFGYQLHHYDVSFLAWEQTPPPNGALRVDAFVHTLYANLRLAQNAKYGAEIGTRLSLFSKDGNLYPEPRLKGWVVLGKGKRLYAHAGRYQQFVSQLAELRGENIGMQPTVWFLSDTKDLQVLTSYHAQIGTIIEQGAWLFDVQAYVRYMDGLSLRTSALGVDFEGDIPIFGTGLARGVDVLIKWRNRYFKSWISYSLGKIDNQFDRLLQDRNFVAPHDIRHQLNWVGMLDYKQWKFSLAWMGRTGTPYTEVTGVNVMPPMGTNTPPTYTPVFEEINGLRTGFHHTLNTSIQYHLGAGQKDKINGIIGLSLQNVYNAENVFLRTYVFSRRDGITQYLPVDRLDLGLTPNLTLQLFW